MTSEQKKAAYIVQQDFVNYRRNLINIWRDYEFIQQTVLDFKSKIANKTLGSLKIQNHNNNGYKEFFAHDINGICDRLIKRTNSKKALINAVSLSENFMQQLGETIYKTYPDKISSKESVEAIGQQIKLMHVIMDSASKEEMLEKLIEEKLRGIFYGNPIEFFERDKGKYGFKSVFKDQYPKSLLHYGEVINRRNINIHNQGMVDRKYIRETGSALKLGSKPQIDTAYLKSAILLLLGMSGISTKLVLEDTLSASNYHKFIHSACRQFNADYK